MAYPVRQYLLKYSNKKTYLRELLLTSPMQISSKDQTIS